MSETLARMPTTIAPSDLPAPHDPDLPYAISMVCTGNICRSAMAEVVLIDRLAAAGRERASLFTWEESARAHAAVYQDLVR